MSDLYWTTETPTEPGWYWCRILGRPELSTQVVYVTIDKYGDFYAERDFGIRTTGEEVYQWAGPIPEPQGQP